MIFLGTRLCGFGGYKRYRIFRSRNETRVPFQLYPDYYVPIPLNFVEDIRTAPIKQQTSILSCLFITVIQIRISNGQTKPKK